MRILGGHTAAIARQHFAEAAEAAQRSTCLRAHGGSVIVSGDEVIGRGYNSPPLGKESNRTCLNIYSGTEKPRFDVTCCIHAEWRAIFDALRRNPDRIPGSRIYYVRVNDDGSYRKAGQPYCTVCSRLALETGITEFTLWQEEGIAVYDTIEYDQLSYAFFKPNKTKDP